MALNPEEVYVIGAAGFWLKQAQRAASERRIFAALERKFREWTESDGDVNSLAS